MILIVGATGSIGRHAVAELVKQGGKLRVISRDPEKTRALPHFGNVDVVTADPTQPGSLAPAFAGADKVLLIPPSSPNWDVSEKNLIDAAKHAGAKHVVKTSVMGADPSAPSMSLSFHYRGEKNLAASGVPFTVLRPNSFMQNFLMYYAPTIRSDGAFYGCVGDSKLAVVDTRDIAEVAVAALTDPGTTYHGKTYDVTGPEALTYADAAQKISAASGRAVRYQDLPPDTLEQALLGAGVPGWVAAELVNIYGRGPWRNSGTGAPVSSTVKDILGRAPRSFDDFAREFAADFRPST
jgi:uncharacterized protein YbjT (DUF2867 family)